MSEPRCSRCRRPTAASSVGPVAAVIFDWYDTIAALPASRRSASFDSLASELGLGVEPGALWSQWSSKPAWQRPALDDALCGEYPFATFAQRWAIAGGELLARHGFAGGGSRFAAMQAELHATAPPFDDAAHTIDELSTTYRLGVLSDADRAFLNCSIDTSGFTFEAVLSSEELHVEKPHATAFEAACERLGAAPRTVVYVGDSQRADIVGAIHAGLRAVWVNRLDRKWIEDSAQPTATIRSLEELPDVIGSFAS